MRRFENLDLDNVEPLTVIEAITTAGMEILHYCNQVAFVVPMVEGSFNLMAAAAHLTYCAGDDSDVIADLFMMAKTVETPVGLVVYFPGLTWPAGMPVVA